jgi:carboxypeptidase Q
MLLGFSSRRGVGVRSFRNVIASAAWALLGLLLGQSAIQAGAQPVTETLDLNMYERIRSEGFDHSRVMEYASVLADDIGPRLTGSPQLARATAWTRDTLAAMGSANAHLEDWGEFGMGWEQESSSLRMVSPAPAVFIAHG